MREGSSCVVRINVKRFDLLKNLLTYRSFLICMVSSLFRSHPIMQIPFHKHNNTSLVMVHPIIASPPNPPTS